MGGYVGNPTLTLCQQDVLPVANYQYPSDPTISANPKRIPCSWLNTATGELFVCTDNTSGANVWRGSHGTNIGANALTPISSLVFSDNIVAQTPDRFINRTLMFYENAAVSETDGVDYAVFDGTDDYAQFDIELKSLKDFTYSVWFKWDSARGLIYQDRNVVLRVDDVIGGDRTIVWDGRNRTGDLTYFDCGDFGFSTDSTLQNLIITSDGTSCHNGVEKTPSISSGSSTSTFSNDYVGAYSSSSPVSGGVSVTRIDVFDVVLSADEQKAVFEKGI